MNSGHPILSVSRLGKRFGGHRPDLGRLGRLLARGHRDAASNGSAKDGLWAVRDVSFDVARGESLGLIGRNGSGKSTLLRMLAGTARPTTGQAVARAPLASLLELGSGFHALETGRENAEAWLVLVGGMHRDEARKATEEVEAFAGIGEYFDRPLRTCSSGMQLRVAFATAAVLAPEILVTDEVLAVGDESFQRKCNSWFDGFLARGGSLVLCAHDLQQVQRLCERTIWLDAGRIRAFGPTRDVIREYRRSVGGTDPGERDAGESDAGTAHAVGESTGLEFEVVDMHLRDALGAEVREISTGEDLTVFVDIRAGAGVPNVHISFTRADGVPVYGISSDMDGAIPRRLAADLHRYTLRFPALALLPGTYVARSHALDETGTRLYDTVTLPLVVRGDDRGAGLVRATASWIED